MINSKKQDQYKLFHYPQSKGQSKHPATLKRVQYKCQILNNILKTTIHQTFQSQGQEFSDTLYLFPIEENICLESFEARYDQQIIRGIIKEKEVAQQLYEKNKQEGNFVSYAEIQKSKIQEYLEIKIGNLPPNVQIEIVIVFSSQLQSYFNKYYMVDLPLKYVYDELDTKMGRNLLTLDLFCTGKITYLYSKSCKVENKMIDENTSQISLQQVYGKDEIKLQLLFSFEGMFEPQVIYGSSQIFNEDAAKRSIIPPRNSVMVSFIPNFNLNVIKEFNDVIYAAMMNGDDIFDDKFTNKVNQEVVDFLDSSKCEFIFLLDRSGSMRGQPMDQAKDALKLFLKSLPSDSYFNVISFGSKIELLFDQPVKYSVESLENAITQINLYSADLGGTDIYKPLEFIFNKVAKISGYNKQIYLLTDGEVQNPEQVVKLIKQNNKKNRVHSIGFGNEADKFLIEQSAIAGKGIHKFIYMKDDLIDVILGILLSSLSPTLNQFKIKYDEVVFESMYPSVDDIFCVFKDEIFNLHLFFKPLIDIQSLTQAQKTIFIEYFDSLQKQLVQKEIILQMTDSFANNKEIQETVFKIGKQISLNNSFQKGEVTSNLVQQAIDFQLLTEKTGLICFIQTLNDENKIMYQNISNNIHYSNQENQNQCDDHEDEKVKRSKSCSSSNNDIIDEEIQHLKGELEQRMNYLDQIYRNNQQDEQQKQLRIREFKEQIQLIALRLYEIESSKESQTIKRSKRNVDSQQLKQQQQQQQQEQERIMEERLFQQQIQQKQEEMKRNGLQDILEGVNSEGVWKYNQQIVDKYFISIDDILNNIISQFNNKDAFMTMVILILLELKYSNEKAKWLLISKKSIKYIQQNINEEEQFVKIKEQISKIINSNI